MDSQFTISLEGASIGFLGAVVLLLICLIIIKRRREIKRLKIEKKTAFTRIDQDLPAASFLRDRTGEDTTLAPTQISTVQPSKEVTWANPVIERIKRPRSESCPERRNAVADITEELEGQTTPWKRKTRKYKRSKTDSCYHLCQIQFSVFYNHYHSKLTVQLLCAVNIPSTFGVNYGSSVELELLPNSEKLKTNVQLHTNNPVFDESKEFAGIAPDELLNTILILRLLTWDRFSHSTLVGQVVAPLAELDINPKKPTTLWRPVTSSSDQQSRISSSLLSLKGITDRGELTISLKYQVPTNKITVVIMKASNLPNISKIFANDPYVIVKLLLNFKTVQTKKTSIKRRTTTPCWNEPLVFEIDPKIPISEYSMFLKVKSHNSLSEDPTVGEIHIGYHSDNLGREHWKDMILKKNRDKAMCHKIK